MCHKEEITQEQNKENLNFSPSDPPFCSLKASHRISPSFKLVLYRFCFKSQMQQNVKKFLVYLFLL